MYKVLDLFCGAGGAAMGMHRAWDDALIIGVDIVPQPRYPFHFVQGDALKPPFDLREFDFIWASPKCQGYSDMQNLAKARNGEYPEHEKQIDAVRVLLQSSSRPYVIENVRGARRELENHIQLCGAQFGLKTYRHRYFEVVPFILAPPHIPHHDQTPSAGNGLSPKGFISIVGSGGVRGMTNKQILDYWRGAMGIDWMSREELSEAIPPAYSEYIARQIRPV